MKSTLLLYLTLLCFSLLACEVPEPVSKKEKQFRNTENTFELPDSLSSRRVAFVVKLKEEVAKTYWEEFGKKKVEGTFIYFNGDKSEVFFPSLQVLAKLDSYESYSDEYVLSPRTDSIPYHFELMISFDSSDSSKFYFEHPVQQFLSVEETTNYIPSVESTEMWTTLVIHEMFHHFQYNNPSFIEYGRNEIGILPFDVRDLIRLCQDDEDFLKMVQLENKYLLDALAASDTDILMSIIKKYLKARSQRIESYGEVYPYLEKVENYYITQEGSPRYIEYQSMKVLSEFAQSDTSPIIEDDPRFNNFKEFETVSLTDPEFSYLTYAGETTYHYALGFNLLRLLDRLEVDYKNQLLNNPGKSLPAYLEEYVRS